MAMEPQFQHFDAPPFQNYGYCDSYFVQSSDDEDGFYARAAAERECQRQVAKLRQKALAEQMSRRTAEEYQGDIMEHMEHMEAETMPDLQSIEIQTEIQWYMRPYLLDFLLEAHHAFALLPETLQLTVNILDRYCSRRVVYKRHYQLVGCAALLIAAKYGDRKERVPTIRELRSMCCSLYDEDMFTQMEWHVLQTLNWIIGHPTVTGFLQLALQEDIIDPELEHMSWYITELALYHKEFIPVRPSVMARSALALARCILNRSQARYGDWSASYEPQVILALSNHLTRSIQALSRKYASPHLSSVSTTVDRFLVRQATLAVHTCHAPQGPMQPIGTQYAPAGNSHLLTPTTPQKPGYTMAPPGVLTPPITPDHELCYQQSHGPQVPYPAPTMTTPPYGAEHLQVLFTQQNRQYATQQQSMQ